MIELMIVIAILAALATLILYAGSRVIAANKPTQCKAQLAMLADAVRRYSDAWPAWKQFVPTFGRVEQITTKGYPDWNGTRLFASPPFANRAGWYDSVIYNDLFNEAGTNFAREVENTNECLAYSLLQPTHGGPFLKDTQFSKVGLEADGKELYPSTASGNTLSRHEIEDPWDNLFRVFWVYRSPNAGNPSGWLPVGVPGTNAPTINYSQNNLGALIPPKATGIVIESAGPDKKFGNRWKDMPTAQEAGHATDNIWELIQ